MGPFSELGHGLPDGAFWIEGSFVKQLFAMMDADRFRLAIGSGSEFQTGDGRFGVIEQGSGGRTVTPWELSITDDKVTVFPGTLNGLLPGNIFTPISISATGVQYVLARATTDGTKVTAVTIVVTGTPPTSGGGVSSGTAPTQFDVLLGATKDGIPYQIESVPLQFIPEVVGTVSRTVSSGAEEPFTRLYSWARSS